MTRFYCPSCEMFIPDSRVKVVRTLPRSKPPWPVFEGEQRPVCPVCDEDLTDTTWARTDLSKVIGAIPDLPELREETETKQENDEDD